MAGVPLQGVHQRVTEFRLRVGKCEEGGNNFSNRELVVHERSIRVVSNKQRLRGEDRPHDPDRCGIAIINYEVL